jgi:pyruvate ferredoxin oxidoreductase delta subunit
MLTDEQKKAIKKTTIKRTMYLKNNQKNNMRNGGTWHSLEKGAVIPESGNSKQYITGNWVPKKLIFNPATCINCGLCWPVCPDDAIMLDKEGNMIGIDVEHCKDCGMCIEACPTKPKSLLFEDDSAKEI